MPPLTASSTLNRVAPWLAAAALALAVALGLGNVLLARRVAALEAEMNAQKRRLADHADNSIRDHREMGRLLRYLHRDLDRLEAVPSPPAGEAEPLR